MMMAPPQDISKMSWGARYLWGNDFLLATWSFAGSMLPILASGIILVIAYPTDAYGYALIFGTALFFALLFLWVLASFPENLQANDGRGSSIIYDSVVSKCCGSCCSEKFMRTHLGSDFLVGTWAFFVVSVLLVPAGIVVVVYEPTDSASWCQFAYILGFAAGAGLMTYTTYPQNMNSRLVWNWLTCSVDGKSDMAKPLLDAMGNPEDLDQPDGELEE